MSTRTAGPSRFPQGLVVSSPFRAMSGTSPVLAVLVACIWTGWLVLEATL